MELQISCAACFILALAHRRHQLHQAFIAPFSSRQLRQFDLNGQAELSDVLFAAICANNGEIRWMNGSI